MKKIIFLFLIILSSCVEPRHITVSYIKNNIVKNSAGEESSVSIYPLYGYKYVGSDKYVNFLEMCAVKYNGEKILVIGSDRYELNKNQDTQLLNRHFKKLSEDECLSIIDKSEELWINVKRAKFNEQIHYNYTVQEGFVISVKQRGLLLRPEYHVWIDRRDHLVDKREFLNSIKKFIRY